MTETKWRDEFEIIMKYVRQKTGSPSENSVITSREQYLFLKNMSLELSRILQEITKSISPCNKYGANDYDYSYERSLYQEAFDFRVRIEMVICKFLAKENDLSINE